MDVWVDKLSRIRYNLQFVSKEVSAVKQRVRRLEEVSDHTTAKKKLKSFSFNQQHQEIDGYYPKDKRDDVLKRMDIELSELQQTLCEVGKALDDHELMEDGHLLQDRELIEDDDMLEDHTKFMAIDNGPLRQPSIFKIDGQSKDDTDIDESCDLDKNDRHGHLDKEQLLWELETLYDKMPIALCLIDDQMRFVRVNFMMACMTGLEVQSHSGRSIKEVIPSVALELETIYTDVFSSGIPIIDVELPLGDRYWLASFYPVTFPEMTHGYMTSQVVQCPQTPASSPSANQELHRTRNKPLAVATVIKDITDIKQKEEDLLAEKRRVEEANHAKSKFLAHMSHELRTPMACISGMVNLIQDSDLSTDQLECVNAIQQNTSSLLQILNDILDLSKVEAGQILLDPHPFELVTIMEKVAEMFAYKLWEKKLHLVLRFDPNLSQQYIGDPVRIRQILWNLVGNSVKFTDTGHISIEIGCLPNGDPEMLDKGIYIKVSDTGIGIPDNQISTIFNEFKQADNSASRAYSGTGLGLAIVERYVHIMNGKVTVKSKVNQGTTFFISLPLQSHVDATVATIPQVITVKEISAQRKFKWVIVSSLNVTKTTLTDYLALCDNNSVDYYDSWADLQNVLESAPHHYQQGNTVFFFDTNTADAATTLRLHLSSVIPKSTSIILIPFAEKAKLKIKETPYSRFVIKPIRLTKLLGCMADAMNLCIQPNTQQDLETLEITQAPKSSPQVFPNLKVLVVEDNPTNQKILKRLLEKMQCKLIDIASNGREALNKINGGDYDLVFMDLQMPVMDGYSATVQIRQNEKETKNHLPIIAVTAHAMTSDKGRCFEVGMDDYVTKPIELNQVQTILTKCSGGEYTLGASVHKL